jgi:DNA-directed RNA polymerase II subunit RPB1
VCGVSTFLITTIYFLQASAHDGCGCFQPRFKKKGLEITAKWTRTNEDEDMQETKLVLSAERVLEVFRNISVQDCDALGLDPALSRPEWMLLTVLPVPPLCVRPSVLMFGSSRSQVQRLMQNYLINKHAV